MAARFTEGLLRYFGGFWEGACDVEGTFQGRPAHGVAFAELVKRYEAPKIRLRFERTHAGIVVAHWHVKNPDEQVLLFHRYAVEDARGRVLVQQGGLDVPVAILDDPALPAHTPLRLRVTSHSVDGTIHGTAHRSFQILVSERMAKTRVAIFGGGLSALSAGIHLLQEGGAERFDVTLLCMEHRLGGKAASWHHPDGRTMETGFHAVFGYYHALRTLLARAGHPVTDRRFFTSNEGVHLFYEPSARTVNRIRVPRGPSDVGAFFNSGLLTYRGMTLTEKARAAAWLSRTLGWLLTHEVSPDCDEHDFSAYCMARGLGPELSQRPWFRYVYDLCFNAPNGASAYVGLYGFQRLLGPDSSAVYYLNGPLGETIVGPVAALYRRLGGKVRFCAKVSDVELDRSTWTLRRFAVRAMARYADDARAGHEVVPEPIGSTYSLADAPYPTGDSAPPPDAPRQWLEQGRDFDEVVWTLPVDSTRALLRTTPGFEEAVLDVPELRKIWALRTVASLSMRMWLPRKVIPGSYSTVVMGTPQPMATLIDYTNRIDELRHGPYGSILELEGQEGFWAELTDAEIAREAVRSLLDLPFVDASAIDAEALLASRDGYHLELRRNTAHHMRYLLMEPGHWKHRPRRDHVPYGNLTLAGDWIHGTQPTASMEAAVRSGREAADTLRHRAGLPNAEA